MVGKTDAHILNGSRLEPAPSTPALFDDEELDSARRRWEHSFQVHHRTDRDLRFVAIFCLEVDPKPSEYRDGFD